MKNIIILLSLILLLGCTTEEFCLDCTISYFQSEYIYFSWGDSLCVPEFIRDEFDTECSSEYRSPYFVDGSLGNPKDECGFHWTLLVCEEP